MKQQNGDKSRSNIISQESFKIDPNSLQYTPITDSESRRKLVRPRVIKDPPKVNPNDIEAFYKIVLIGDSDVGKTSLLLRYASDVFTEKPCTIGVDFKIKTLKVDNKVVKI